MPRNNVSCAYRNSHVHRIMQLHRASQDVAREAALKRGFKSMYRGAELIAISGVESLESYRS